MLTEEFVVATYAANKQSAHISSALKDVGIFQYELQPQTIFRSGFKKSSVRPQCLALSDSHVFSAQAEKAVINVYNRMKGNQEATVPFPDKIHSLAYASRAAVLVLGTEDGKLILWETATGRISTSAAAHLQPVSHLAITANNDVVLSASADASIHVWSISQLVSFRSSRSTHKDSVPVNSPSRSFSHHRASITALKLGHSNSATNFAISASSDKTCYLWHLNTCQVLRTILLPINAMSIAIDPADRAVYFGLENGGVQNMVLLGQQSIFDNSSSAPHQLVSKESWDPSSADVGHTLCLALVYDGTTLLSGHQGGSVIRWDVAKHRVVSEIANVHQPVTNIQSIIPDGLLQKKSHFSLPVVVKPRLELNIEEEQGSIGVPATYGLQAQINRSCNAELTASEDDVSTALSNNHFPSALLEDAVQAMLAQSTGINNTIITNDKSKVAGYKIEQLQEELAAEKKNVAWFQKHYQEQQRRHSKRQEVRRALGIKKREAYYAAEKQGQNGDAAMKLYHEVESMLDSGSDEEVLSHKKDIEDVLDHKMDIDIRD